MLDDLKKISELDKGHILASIERLPEQMQNAWDGISYINFPKNYSEVTNILLSGMGGSALGARIIKELYLSRLDIPFDFLNGYHLPKYVDKNTLLILYSYSGNTEETINSAHEAIKQNAKIICITTGGKLEEFASKNNLPIYKIDPINNPSGQPRMGLGYAVISILAILSRLGLIRLNAEDIRQYMKTAETFIQEFGVRNHSDRNIAKKLAQKMANKAIALISSEHLIGSAHAFKNQINENAKQLSFHFPISESNHHLMEGLRYPFKAKEVVHFLFLESKYYFQRNLKRYAITQDVIKQNGYDFDVYKLTSGTKDEEVIEVLILGSYVTFYLAILHNTDPSPIPWVDYFKEKLG